MLSLEDGHLHKFGTETQSFPLSYPSDVHASLQLGSNSTPILDRTARDSSDSSVTALTLVSRGDLGVSRIWCGVWIGYTKLDGKFGPAAVSKGGAGADACIFLIF
jgi:hypothetical protein